MKRTIASLTIAGTAFVLSACGPSDAEVAEERAAEFRGKIVTSCIGSMAESPFDPATRGELCDCAASNVVKEMGVPEEGNSASVPPEVMSKVVKTCLAEVNPQAAGS